MKRFVVGAVVALAVIAGLRFWRSRGESKTAAPAPLASKVPAAPAVTSPPSHVRKISKEERQQLVQRIAAARAAREKTQAQGQADPSRPRLPAKTSADLEHLSTDVLTALKEAIPFLADCYSKVGSGAKKNMRAMAMMTLTGDPDIGTVIDADQIFDDNHQPLEPALDECLRNTMQTLQLPPLEEGDTVKIQYSFAFDDEED